jgi:hypothetical protein
MGVGDSVSLGIYAAHDAPLRIAGCAQPWRSSAPEVASPDDIVGIENFGIASVP